MKRQGSQILRPELWDKVRIPGAQVLTLFTTPVTLIASVPGKVIVPTRAHFFKEAGTAYTIGAATNMRIGWGNPILVTAMEGIPTAGLSGFFNSTLQRSSLSLGPGVSGGASFYNSINPLNDAASWFEQPLSLQIQTANITVGNAEITVTVFYELWGLTVPFD